MCAGRRAVFTALDDYWPAHENYKKAKPQIGKVTCQMEGFLKFWIYSTFPSGTESIECVGEKARWPFQIEVQKETDGD